ncbi:MAG: HsmA family protein [Marinifilaceae bacterium]
MQPTTISLHILLPAVISISMALVCYTIGVWSERIQHTLKGWHTLFFVFGLVFDFIGTSLMTHIAIVTGHHNTVHAISGIVAIVLMTIHATWAVWTYFKGTERMKHNFNKFSIFVWIMWLIPFFIGMYIAMHH